VQAARRRHSGAPDPTLFPFLNVLAAVIGTLILVISGMSHLSISNPDQMVELGPFGTTEKIPVYVECQKERLLIYPENAGLAGAPPPTVVALREFLWDSSPWVRLLEGIRLERQKKYVILLVRPDAIEAFHKVYSSVDRQLVDLGYDPLYETGRVKFRRASRVDPP
jgi:hypothetical protein